ncbi:MAG: site-2 protease family protein [Pirellulales bacterium]
MDLSLIAAFSIDWTWWGNLAQGILGLGLVILIHEFGHFAAAKLCGVKVEKFYIGFDPYGLRLFRFRWGETEYGIGAIPLGGYVYMLGQTDNPGKQAEEAERAKAAAAHGEAVDPEAAAVWDPRSYPAQTVPERMLIISAGVILNAVTAFFFATFAYLLGTDFVSAKVYETAPGTPAWEQDLGGGAEFTRIADVKEPRWDVDLRARVMLADLKKGLPSSLRRDGKDTEITLWPRKDRDDRPPTIGVLMPQLTKLMTYPRTTPENPDRIPAFWGSAAFKATPKFQSGDEVVRLNDTEIKDYNDVIRAEALYAGEPLKVVVRRREPAPEGASSSAEQAKAAPAKELTITIPPVKLLDLGLTMEVGPITGVQDGSPAKAAGILKGDVLKTINGEPLGDPLTLAERLRRQHAEPGKPWTVVVARTDGGKTEDKSFSITPREADRHEWGFRESSPVSVPTLGLAFHVRSTVAGVAAGGPADKAGVKPGDKLLRCIVTPPDVAGTPAELKKPATIEFAKNEADPFNWPFVALGVLQSRPADTKVKLEFEGGKTVELTPIESPDFYNSDRGLRFDIMTFERKAQDLQQAFQYAWTDTRDSLTQVYSFLRALFNGQIPPSNVGGIITIADQAGASAGAGFPKLLLFLMMLSCNLAVINFLPFPVLDGGHMVFLLYEGIFRKPPPEKLHGYLTTLGFFCLLGLMLFALGNDVMRLSK